MLKEIGSIFPLRQADIDTALPQKSAALRDDKLYYALCREALFDIALTEGSSSNRIVLLPAYTCGTVIDPFIEAGWTPRYYSIKPNLRIDIDSLLEAFNTYCPALVLAHPYYGMDLNHNETQALIKIQSQGAKIVIDLTQCILSENDYGFADYVVGSYRKWLPIPDGAFLKAQRSSNIKQPTEPFHEFVDGMTQAMTLRQEYFDTGRPVIKQESIGIDKSTCAKAEANFMPHDMSILSRALYTRHDFDNNANRRCENFKYLFNNLPESEYIRKVCSDFSEVTTAPLYFTIYSSQREALQKKLVENSVYAPVIWPISNDNVLISDDIKYIYEHILAIPIDQRYTLADMDRIVKCLINI